MINIINIISAIKNYDVELLGIINTCMHIYQFFKIVLCYSHVLTYRHSIWVQTD